jgi:hypothetical protein
VAEPYASGLLGADDRSESGRRGLWDAPWERRKRSRPPCAHDLEEARDRPQRRDPLPRGPLRQVGCDGPAAPPIEPQSGSRKSSSECGRSTSRSANGRPTLRCDAGTFFLRSRGALVALQRLLRRDVFGRSRWPACWPRRDSAGKPGREPDRADLRDPRCGSPAVEEAVVVVEASDAQPATALRTSFVASPPPPAVSGGL